MAEIDKSLPNVKQTINVPSPDEVQVEIQEEQKEQDQPIDVQENEDGSVDINFDPMETYEFDNAAMVCSKGKDLSKLDNNYFSKFFDKSNIFNKHKEIRESINSLWLQKINMQNAFSRFILKKPLINDYLKKVYYTKIIQFV